jgi:hypothetical protein
MYMKVHVKPKGGGVVEARPCIGEADEKGRRMGGV